MADEDFAFAQCEISREGKHYKFCFDRGNMSWTVMRENKEFLGSLWLEVTVASLNNKQLMSKAVKDHLDTLNTDDPSIALCYCSAVPSGL